MATSRNLKLTEDRRTEQQESIKGDLREEVHAEIKRKADLDAGEKSQIESVAHELKHKAIREVSSTESETERARTLARLSQFIDYLFSLIYGVMGLLIALELMGARQSNSFKRFVDVVTAPIVAPFRGLMPDPAVGSYQLMISYVVGLIVYALLHLAIKGLLRVMTERKTTI